MCISSKAGSYNVRFQTLWFRYSWQLYGINVFLFSFTVSTALQTQPPLFNMAAKVTPCDPMISYWPCCKETLSVTCWKRVKWCHKSLDLASQTSVKCPYYLYRVFVFLRALSWTVWCQTEDEMSGYFSLSYVWVCYLYCYEKCFR